MDEDILKVYQAKLGELTQEINRKTQEVFSLHQLLAEKDSRLYKLEKEIGRMSKIESEFISNISHELRTPLTSLIQGVELILDNSLGEISLEQRKILEIVYSEIKRLSRLICDVIDISRIEFGKMVLIKEPVELTALIQEAIGAFKEEFERKGLYLNINFLSKKVLVYADVKKIKQVIFNLLENALHFTEKGEVSLGMNDLENEVIVSIRDTGIGIKDEDLNKLFKKFQQFSRQDGPGRKGTGLGLAICKGIIELHKGKIWAESRYGEGSSFNFSLPKLGRRVLLVDDHEDIGLLLKTKFFQDNILMDAVTNIPEARKNLQERGYCLILLDLTLPEISYQEAMESLREVYGGPIIIFSAKDEEELERIKKEIDADDYVRKPCKYPLIKQKLIKYII